MNLLFAIVLGLWSLQASSQTSPNDSEAVEILDYIDRLYFAESSRANITLTVIRPTFQRTLVLDWYSRGLYNVFVKILSPNEQEGKKVLKVGKELFFYEPKDERVIHISQTGALRRFLLSEFSRDDFLNINRLTEEYNVNQMDNGNSWLLILTPKMVTPIVWDKIVFKVDKETKAPLTKSYFNERGAKTKELVYKEPKDINGVMIPTVLEMRSFSNKGFVSRLEYNSIETNVSILPHLFTMKNLKNLIEYE